MRNVVKVFYICIASLALTGVAEAQKGGGKPGGGGGDTLASLNCSTDQIARFNGAAWVCSQDRLGNSFSYRLFDANRLELPVEILSIFADGDQARVTLDVNIDGTLEPVRLSVGKTEIVISHDAYNGVLYYAATDCSGTPFLRNEISWLNSRVIAAFKHPSNDQEYRLVYSVANPTVDLVNIGSHAFYDSSSGGFYCQCFDPECYERPIEVTSVAGSMVFQIPYQLPITLVRE